MIMDMISVVEGSEMASKTFSYAIGANAALSEAGNIDRTVATK
jgi:hypothetical protein